MSWVWSDGKTSIAAWSRSDPELITGADANLFRSFLPRSEEKMRCTLLATVAYLRVTTAVVVKYDDCDVATYYAPVWNLYDATLMADRLKSSHRDVIPYTDTSNTEADCWDALIDLDANPADASEVKLVYRDTYIAATPYGETNTWK